MSTPGPGLLRRFRRISIGSLALYGGFAVRKVGVLILAAVMTRRLGLADFGTYCVALALMEFSSRLAVFGTDVLIVRAVSAGAPDANRFAAQAFRWRAMASALIVCGLVGGSAWQQGTSLMSVVLAVMGLGMVAHVLSDTYLSVIQGLERVHLVGCVQMFCHTVGLTLALAAVWFGLGLVGVAVAYTLRAVLFLLCGGALCHVLNPPDRTPWDRRAVGRMLRQGAPIAAGRLLAVVYLGSGVLAMKHFLGESAAGLFGGAMKLFEGVAALGMLAAVSAYPSLVRLRAAGGDGLRRMVALLIRIIVWVGLPACALLALNAERLLVLLFGRSFAGQGPTLVIFSVALPLSFLCALIERLAYAANDLKRTAVVRAVGTVTAVWVLSAAVRPLGTAGAATAYLAAEAAMLLTFLPKLKSYSHGVSLRRTALPEGLFLLAALAPALLVPVEGGVPSIVFLGCMAAAGFARWACVRPNTLRCIKPPAGN